MSNANIQIGKMIIIFILILLMNTILNEAQTPCSITDSNSGFTYDFGALKNNSYEISTTGLTFHLTPCAINLESKQPPCQQQSPVVYFDNVRCWYCATLETQQFSITNDSKILLAYSRGELGGGCSTPRQVNIIFECDPSDRGLYQVKVDTPVKCTHSLYWKSKYACGINNNTPNNGLTGGSWFLITIFAIVLPVYLIGGILYNYKIKGSTGWEVLPNIQFWIMLPLLVRDGCKFTFKICTPSSYQKI